MSNIMKKLTIFFNHKSIILFYLSLSIFILLYSALFQKEVNNILLARAIFIIIYSAISVFAIKKNRVAIWIIAVIIFISGLWILMISLFFTSINQYILKVLFIIISVYFFCAAFILLKRES